MIRRIIAFSAHNRLLVLLAVAALSLAAVQVLKDIRLDALPDLSDTQVIVYSRWDRSPDIVEDQVTYPIVASLLGAPKVKAIRGFSDFGFSFVYVIFEDGTDLYWARSRVARVPVEDPAAPARRASQPSSGPTRPASGGSSSTPWSIASGTHPLDELRSYQDWTLRYALQAVPGVAEVASIGGFVRQFQITVDPNRLAAYRLPLDAVVAAVRAVEQRSGRASARVERRRVHGARPRLRQDARRLRADRGEGRRRPACRCCCATSARIDLGPEMRRGVSDLDGLGDTVGGIVVMRHGENALNVIERVKARLHELEPSLPQGVEIVTTYDRADLISRAIDTLTHELIDRDDHRLAGDPLCSSGTSRRPSCPSSPSRCRSCSPSSRCYFMGVTVNIMSLAGIAISIGVLVDGAIVEVENAYNQLHRWQAEGRQGDFHAVRLEALQEVGPAVFFSLLVIAVAFLPVFTLVDQEGRLFKPLAYSKNLAMALAAVLAITLDPAMRMLFARMDPVHVPAALARLAGDAGSSSAPTTRRNVIRSAGCSSPSTSPACRVVLRFPKATVAAALAAVAASVPVYFSLGSEFMPPLNEGTILYMPTTLPGISVAQARSLLETQDRVLQVVPGGRARLRQGRPRRHLHRSGAVLDDGDHGGPEAGERMAREAALVLRTGAGLAEARCCARSGPIASRGRNWWTRWTGRFASPASPTPGRCRSRRASTC